MRWGRSDCPTTATLIYKGVVVFAKTIFKSIEYVLFLFFRKLTSIILSAVNTDRAGIYEIHP